MTYENGRKRQDVWSKREWEVPEPGAGAGEPVVFTKEQAKRLQAEHGLTKPAESGTIQQGPSLRISMQFFAHRNSEDMPTIRLPKQEYAHVMSEIASHLTDDDKTSPVFVKRIGNYQYTVENHGFGDYRIIGKKKIKMDDVKTRLRNLLLTLTENEEYILGVLDNAPHVDDMEFLCNYIENNPNVSISDIILHSCELGMIRDGELEPLPDNVD